MDEEDRRSIDLAPFAHMQLHATSADYGMNFHLVLHSLIPGLDDQPAHVGAGVAASVEKEQPKRQRTLSSTRWRCDAKASTAA
jgi:hypothetical protein